MKFFINNTSRQTYNKLTKININYHSQNIANMVCNFLPKQLNSVTRPDTVNIITTDIL